MEKYDVIVAGCGPCGAMAARAAAKAGAKVLAIDRRKELGAPVRCGEGIGLHWMEELGIKMNPKAVSAEINGSLLISPDWKRKVMIKNKETKGFVVDRKVFDKELAIEAGRCGADILVHSEIYDVIREGGKTCGVKALVDGKKQEFRAEAVIAADGGESTVARLAGLNTVASLYDTDFGVEYEMVNVECEDLIEVYFSNADAPRGYVWIFPKGKDVANVGIGVLSSLSESGLAMRLLDEFIANHPELRKGEPVRLLAGADPVAKPIESVRDNLVLVGDAARQVDPITGGGLMASIEGGMIAGDVIGAAVKKQKFDKDVLMAYETRWQQAYGKKLLRNYVVKEILLDMEDKTLDMLADSLKDYQFEEFSTLSLIKALVGKHPSLLVKLTPLMKLART